MEITKFIKTKFRDYLNENIVLDITKNTEPAPYLGSRFGQDVEAKGTYVLHGKIDAPCYVNGEAVLKKTTFYMKERKTHPSECGWGVSD